MQLPTTISAYSSKYSNREHTARDIGLISGKNMVRHWIHEVPVTAFRQSWLRNLEPYHLESFPALVMVPLKSVNRSHIETVVDLGYRWSFFLYEYSDQNFFFAFEREEEATMFKLMI